MVVQLDEVIAKKGPIPVSGRYTCCRQLEQEYTISDKVLGSGMNGPVLLATGKADGRKYAVKSFKKGGLSTRHRQELKNEAELYLTLDHPHIAQLRMVFETDEVLHLVMEYMEGGELYDRLAAKKRYTEEAAADTTYQMLLAVAYLHAHKIAHRDLKLENFMYERKDANHMKLIDFGFAKYWDPSTKMSQACGSVHYVAPEVLLHSYTVQADMWSIGIIAYMLLTGSPAFHGSDSDILRKVKAGRPHYSTRFLRLSSGAQAFVKELLVSDPNERLTAAGALEHPWIKGRHLANDAHIDAEILGCLRTFAHASRFRRAALCMMAWSLSTEEQEELREQFLLMDTQKRGSITLKELKAILEENFHISSAEAERLFNSLDADNSEEIEYTEFLAAALLGRVKAHEDVLRRTFKRFDQDESGRISVDEFRSLLGDTFEGADIEDLIREADTSGDGMIDYDEFIAYFQKSDPEIEEPAPPSSSARASRRRARTEKLGAVIDRLMEETTSVAAEEPKAATDDTAHGGNFCGSLRPFVHRLERRSKTAPGGLPVLLGSPSAMSTRATKP